MESHAYDSIRSMFVVDSGASWIRSLLNGMPPSVRIHGFRIHNLFSFPGSLRGLIRKVGKWEKVSESWEDTWVCTPSWHKAFEFSSWIVEQHVKLAIRRLGPPDVMLFTLPWYARVAESCPGLTKAYYAHDTFRFYQWDSQKIVALETRLLTNCNVGFGVAKLVVSDLRELAATPVHYLPMATTTQRRSARSEEPADGEFREIPSPRVGCVGQVSDKAYDWDLIEYLGTNLPQAHFVFIGPLLQATDKTNRITTIFNRPNVHWLGEKPHATLPNYLRGFDVCINPLRVNEHNHRRSPLRLFDYLTTDRPIISTALEEAFNHVPHVNIARSNEEFCQMLSDALNLKTAPDLEGRRAYIAGNSWHSRAAELLQRVTNRD
jgi:glycosyltransferase involved in cell wall biosynthesis